MKRNGCRSKRRSIWWSASALRRIASRCASLAVCLALFPSAPAPDAGLQDKPRITRGELQRAEVVRLEKEIQGLWKIERVRLKTLEFQGAALAGYMLAAPGYATLEFHVQNYPNDGGFDGIEIMFQTGIYNYRFTPLGEIEMFGMIGTNNLNSNEADFEPPGLKRKYEISLTADQMTLERPEARLVLSRVSRPPHTSDKK
jgi:hypothetical protein